MAKIHNNTVARNAKKEYKTHVIAIEKELIDTFLTDIEIQIKHSEVEKKALDYFVKDQMGDEESNLEIMNEFKKVNSQLLTLRESSLYRILNWL